MIERLKAALGIFLGCPDWARFVHNEDCLEPGVDGDEETEGLCVCDGPGRAEFIRGVAKEVGIHLFGER